MRILLAIIALTLFTACDRIDLSDISTASSATTAAVGTAFLTTNPVAIGAATATSAVAGAYLVKDDKSLSTEQIKEVENPWQAMLVAFDQLLAHAFELVIAIGIAVIGIPMLITYLMGRFKQRPEDAKTITNLVEKIGKMKEND